MRRFEMPECRKVNQWNELPFLGNLEILNGNPPIRENGMSSISEHAMVLHETSRRIELAPLLIQIR